LFTVWQGQLCCFYFAKVRKICELAKKNLWKLLLSRKFTASARHFRKKVRTFAAGIK